MPLQPGTRLGPYEVTAAIGAGGMGEVYRARDTALNRDVAIKVLPEILGGDADRLARFQREAEALAALNHPNIAQIYGLEKSGDTPAIVMELVEGPTLADRIAAGALPLDEALPIALQIIEALEAAHERGIIHRDLKPANVKVREDGTVKVLDFGLAKAIESPGEVSPELANSPTLTARATQMGMVLGTAAYMAPEQAKGKPVDKRADVFAFGAVLYEMLTGRRAFGGSDVSDVLASVLKIDPDWDALPATTPVAIRKLLRQALEKDRKNRLPDIAVARLEIAEARAEPDAAPIEGRLAESAAARRSIMPVMAALIIGAAAATMFWTLWPTPDVATGMVRFAVSTPEPLQLWRSGNSQDLTISPDGRTIVHQGPDQLVTRPMDERLGGLLRGTEMGYNPSVSPDSAWVAFSFGSSAAQLSKVPLSGGAPVALAELPSAIRGIAWAGDELVVGTSSDGLFRVPVGGGDPEPLTTLDAEQGELTHRWPFFVQGANTVLFTAASGPSSARLEAVALDTGLRTSLDVSGMSPRYVSTGHLLYAGQDGLVYGVPFDIDALEVAGNPASLVDGVDVKITGAANFAVSDDGHLVYVPGGASEGVELTLVDRDGREESLPTNLDSYSHPRVSPDGTKLAIERPSQGGRDIWIWDLNRGGWTQFTFDEAEDFYPLWTTDGARIVFGSGREPSGLFVKNADGSGQVESLVTGANLSPHTWSADGSVLVAQDGEGFGGISMTGEARVEPLLDDEGFLTNYPRVSPDGRWIAYVANVPQGDRVFVRPFGDPTAGGRWQVSPEEGDDPVWSADGRELFYFGSDGQLLGVAVGDGPTFSYGVPDVILEGPYQESDGVQYDVTPDGRFLMLKRFQADEGARAIEVVLNWFEELVERLPVR